MVKSDKKEKKKQWKRYTAIIRKSKLEYIAICLELNLSARGEDLAPKRLLTEVDSYAQKEVLNFILKKSL